MSGDLSVAIHALLLIRLQAWYGQWLTVPALADHLAVPQAVVRVHLQAMADGGEVALRHDAQGLVEAACIGPAGGAPDAEPPATPGPPGLERTERPSWPAAGHSEALAPPPIAA